MQPVLMYVYHIIYVYCIVTYTIIILYYTLGITEYYSRNIFIASDTFGGLFFVPKDLKFEITQKCFFDVEIDDNKMGRIACSPEHFAADCCPS